jgi:hypothetical protein
MHPIGIPVPIDRSMTYCAYQHRDPTPIYIVDLSEMKSFKKSVTRLEDHIVSETARTA